jgi:hypothetical protein
MSCVGRVPSGLVLILVSKNWRHMWREAYHYLPDRRIRSYQPQTSTCLVGTWGNTRPIYKSQYPVCNFHMSGKNQPWTLIPRPGWYEFLQRSNTSNVQLVWIFFKNPILLPSWYEVRGGNPCWRLKQTSWCSCEEVLSNKFYSGPVLVLVYLFKNLS